MHVGGLLPDNGPGGGAQLQDRRVEAANEGGQSYATVLKQKVTPYQRMELTYIEPQLVDGKPLVEIPFLVTMAGKERWKHMLIGYVLGLNPSFTDMEGFVKARWAELGEVRVHLMGKGLFVFQMESEEARQGALERGPWSFSWRPLILKPWSVRMALEKPDVDNLPVWVQYPHLPIDLWTLEALSRISSQLGKPLFADRNTSEQRRLGYARVCVEVKVESTLFEEIPIKYANGYAHYQKVHYEWVPSKCMKCKVFGHNDQQCKTTQVFLPKQVGGKEVVIGKDVPSSSGTMQFGAIEVDPATLLPTPLSPIGEEEASGEDEVKGADCDLEANILQKVSSVIAQLAAESVEQQKGGVGNAGKSKKKGRGNGQAAAPPPQPV
ncbi:hypothetical protein LIER_43608 [Lithospermum erythrorhizon]|uniref:DUF4283 domain-containing protein n=1 Tax=Lithospermum erythrorhizon TaxID=34254 RepID=A0AAV3QH51_LITER